MQFDKPSRREKWQIVPPETSTDAHLLLWGRAARAFGDGFVSVLLPLHLAALGLSNIEVGAIATATLVGSAAMTLFVGFIAYRVGRRALLVRASLLMIATGVGFALLRDFWPPLVVGFLGTINPSSGDASVFLPTEQALLPQTTSDRQRTALFARYSLIGTLAAAFGALAAGVPGFLATGLDMPLARAVDVMFLLYAALGLLALVFYRELSPSVEPAEQKAAAPLGKSKRTVWGLAALFSLDSFGSGFVVQSLLALWLFQRFGLSMAATGAIFFWSGFLSAFSVLASVQVARRIGLINTAVFTHLPANLFLILTPFMPTVEWAAALLLLRSAFSSMDVPVRNSYVMAVVSPAERPAAASATAVPRGLAAAVGPVISGWLLGVSVFGWPLVIAGTVKTVYDVLLLVMFRSVRPPEERHRERVR